MIQSNYLPPHPKAVEDLLSLLSIVTNPAAVSKYTQSLLEAASQYTEASKGYVDKEAELKAKELGLRDAQFKLDNDLRTLELREREVERQEKDSADKAAKAYKLVLDSEATKKDLEEFAQRLAHEKANFEQTSKSKTANLVEWERNLTNDIEAHKNKVKAIKELIHV